VFPVLHLHLDRRPEEDEKKSDESQVTSDEKNTRGFNLLLVTRPSLLVNVRTF
jgi:hypothetical protein